MEYHWCLLWGHERFTVVYCRDPNIIGDYCGLLMNPQWSTAEGDGDYYDTQSGCSWLLQTNEGSTVVNCSGWNVNGNYCNAHLDIQLTTGRPMRVPQWSAAENWMSLGVTVSSIIWPSWLLQIHKGSQWSTAGWNISDDYCNPHLDTQWATVDQKYSFSCPLQRVGCQWRHWDINYRELLITVETRGITVVNCREWMSLVTTMKLTVDSCGAMIDSL